MCTYMKRYSINYIDIMILSSSSSSLFGTRGRSLPDILATGSLVPNTVYRELEDQGYASNTK